MNKMEVRLKLIPSLILLFVLNLLMITRIGGQTHNYDRLIKEYLISKDELKDDEKISFYALELLKLSEIQCNRCGIYKIGNFSDHGLIYLFLLDKDKNKELFLDCNELSKTIEHILNFLDNASCKFTDTEKLLYIRKVVEIYNINENRIPW
jgi:hypothetical protein